MSRRCAGGPHLRPTLSGDLLVEWLDRIAGGIFIALGLRLIVSR